MTLPDPNLPWPIPLKAVGLIADAEGCRLKAYRCAAGVPTIGWGHTGPEVILGATVWTQEQADRALCDELVTFSAQVRAACTQAPTPDQLGAMTSLAYNVGADAFRKSTVLKAHNAGDWQAAARAFSLWDKAKVNGSLQSLPGLTARRAAEAALYLRTDDEAPGHVMPQAVEPETSITASPIAKGGSAITLTGIVAAAAEAKDALGPVGEALQAGRHVLADILGVPPSWVLPIILVVVGGAIVRARLQQRGQGWA